MIKKLIKRKNPKKTLPSRITNDTVAEHREKILAKGRKHKYPVQYTKHKLVWVTALVAVVMLVVSSAFVYVQLYVWKDTGDVAYRITKITSLPIAKIDGEFVRYDDYLMYYRSALAVLKSRGQQGLYDKVEFQQRQSMDKAIGVAYVRKLAREHNITVEPSRADEIFKQQREDRGMSESAYATAIKDSLNWSVDELKSALQYDLLRQEVAFAIDDQARELVNLIQQRIAAGKTLAEIAQEFGDKVQFVPEISVPKDNSDGGLTKAVLSLTVDKISSPLKTLSGDGYYFALLKSVDGDKVSYSYIRVPLTELTNRIKAAKQNGGVQYYTSIKGTE